MYDLLGIDIVRLYNWIKMRGRQQSQAQEKHSLQSLNNTAAIYAKQISNLCEKLNTLKKQDFPADSIFITQILPNLNENEIKNKHPKEFDSWNFYVQSLAACKLYADFIVNLMKFNRVKQSTPAFLLHGVILASIFICIGTVGIYTPIGDLFLVACCALGYSVQYIIPTIVHYMQAQDKLQESIKAINSTPTVEHISNELIVEMCNKIESGVADMLSTADIKTKQQADKKLQEQQAEQKKSPKMTVYYCNSQEGLAHVLQKIITGAESTDNKKSAANQKDSRSTDPIYLPGLKKGFFNRKPENSHPPVKHVDPDPVQTCLSREDHMLQEALQEVDAAMSAPYKYNRVSNRCACN